MTNKPEHHYLRQKCFFPKLSCTSGCAVLVIALLMTGCVSTPPLPTPTESSNPAVLSLLDRARNDMASSHYTSAEANLERALRIEPGNALLWYELAQAAMQQDNLVQAENFALRAHSFSGSNHHLQRKIWYLIGESRNKRSDYEGADEAFRRAETYGHSQ